MWLAAHPLIWRTTAEILKESGRASKGDSRYSASLRSLVQAGHLEMDTRPTGHIDRATGKLIGGRPTLIYRRKSMMFYVTVRDKRYDYLAWDRLPSALQDQAKERYAASYPWLGWQDWLYPLTLNGPRLASGATRVLAITEEEAEAKREAWRSQHAGWLIDGNSYGLL